jgi:hypothetical protein
MRARACKGRGMDSKPWYQSKTIWGAVIATIVSTLHLLGVDLPSDVSVSLPDQIISTVGLIGSILAIIGRFTVKKPVLTATAQSGTSNPTHLLALPFTLMIVIPALALSGCANMTPKQSAIVSSVEDFALSTAMNVGAAYLTGGGMTPALIRNSIDGAAQVVRSIIDTPAATNPQAIQDALASGSASKVVDTQIAPAVAAKAASAIQAGADPNAVIEAVATGLNDAAVKMAAPIAPAQ